MYISTKLPAVATQNMTKPIDGLGRIINIPVPMAKRNISSPAWDSNRDSAHVSLASEEARPTLRQVRIECLTVKADQFLAPQVR